MKTKILSVLALAGVLVSSLFVLAATKVPANPGLIITRKAVSTVYTVSYSDYFVACSGTNYTVTLPAISAGRSGCTFRVGAVGTNAVTLLPAEGDTIARSTNAVTISTLTSLTITSDGVSNWEK